jgi:hypothetical protein
MLLGFADDAPREIARVDAPRPAGNAIVIMMYFVSE